MKYRSRLADKELMARLRASGAVAIEGPKPCGKTKTALQLAHSSVQLDVDEQARQLMQVDPNLVLVGDGPGSWTSGRRTHDCGILFAMRSTDVKRKDSLFSPDHRCRMMMWHGTVGPGGSQF